MCKALRYRFRYHGLIRRAQMKNTTHTFFALLTFLLTASIAFAQSPRAASDDGAARAEIAKLEQTVWDHWKARRIDAMAQYFAADMVAVDEGGPMNKVALLDVLKKQQCTISSAVIENSAVISISRDAYIITYKSKPTGVCDGEPLNKSGDFVS